MIKNGIEAKRTMNHFPKSNITKAFTLIELLVVIAIIALLLSILMPALNKVKDVARQMVCNAHLKPCGMGLATYAAEYEDWIPGPNTSGRRLSMSKPYSPSPTSPVCNIDWISPILGDSLGFGSERALKITRILNSDMKCPSNKKKNDYVYDGGSHLDTLPGTDIKAGDVAYGSYSSPYGFHLVQNGTTRFPSAQSGHPLNPSWGFSQSLQYFEIHKNYTPKVTNVGIPSMKVFAMDGARYYDGSLGQVSFNNATAQDEGGNWMLSGPFFANKGDPMRVSWLNHDDISTYELEEATKELTFRHNEKINAVFFDGHCETLDKEDAFNCRLYLPKKTYITSYGAMYLQDPHIIEGFID